MHKNRLTAREDQREVNNLPKLPEPQQQGRMLVVDEASVKKGNYMNKRLVASELLKMAKDLISTDFPSQEALDKYLKDHPDADRSNHKVVKRDKIRYEPEDAKPDAGEMHEIWKTFWNEMPDDKRKKLQKQHGVSDSKVVKQYEDLPETMRKKMEHRDMAASELLRIAKILIG